MTMKQENRNLDGIPEEGFLKIKLADQAVLSSTQRVALIRKGNELFNAGRLEEAKKIFITTRYGDGITRIGDYCMEKQDPLEALRMYWIAPAPKKREQLIEKTAEVVRSWIGEGIGKSEGINIGTDKPSG